MKRVQVYFIHLLIHFFYLFILPFNFVQDGEDVGFGIYLFLMFIHGCFYFKKITNTNIFSLLLQDLMRFPTQLGRIISIPVRPKRLSSTTNTVKRVSFLSFYTMKINCVILPYWVHHFIIHLSIIHSSTFSLMKSETKKTLWEASCPMSVQKGYSIKSQKVNYNMQPAIFLYLSVMCMLKGKRVNQSSITKYRLNDEI